MPRYTQEVKVKAVEMYADGLSTTKVAKRLNLSPRTVWLWAKAVGINRPMIEAVKRANTTALRPGWKEPTEDLGYIIGVLMGDGSIAQRSIVLQANDKEFVETFAGVCKRQFGTVGGVLLSRPEGKLMWSPNNGKMYRSGAAWRVYCCSVPVSEFLTGVVGNVEYIRLLPTEAKIGWLRGVWDSEGSIVYDGNGFSVCFDSTDNDTLTLYSEILDSFGIPTSRAYRNKHIGTMTTDRIRITSGAIRKMNGRLKNVVGFAELVRPTILRKVERFNEAVQRYALLSVKAREGERTDG